MSEALSVPIKGLIKNKQFFFVEITFLIITLLIFLRGVCLSTRSGQFGGNIPVTVGHHSKAKKPAKSEILEVFV